RESGAASSSSRNRWRATARSTGWRVPVLSNSLQLYKQLPSGVIWPEGDSGVEEASVCLRNGCFGRIAHSYHDDAKESARFGGRDRRSDLPARVLAGVLTLSRQLCVFSNNGMSGARSLLRPHISASEKLGSGCS